MKKISFFLLTVTMMLSVVGCGNRKEANEVNENNQIEVETNDSVEVKEEDKKEETNVIEEWGVQESLYFEKGGAATEAFIKFPSLAGIERATGTIAYQKDESLVILDGELEGISMELADDSVKDVFPTYFAQVIDIMEAYRQTSHTEFAFDIESSEELEINGYQMCKYIGNHTYLYEGEPRSLKYVAYSSQLSNDSYIYWMVLDESKDQSLNKTIEEYADKMAQTLHE